MKIFEIVITCIIYINPIVSIFILCWVYQGYLYRKNKGLGRKVILKHFLWVDVFLLYIALMFDVAGSGTIWDIGKYPTIIRFDEILITPFSSDGILTYLLNIIMFMPFGFLIPVTWEKYQSIKKTGFLGFSLSLYIELTQLLNKRKTDIDDLMMNVLGTLIGFGIFYIWNKRFSRRKTKLKLECEDAIIYLVFAALGRLLLYNWRFWVSILM